MNFNTNDQPEYDLNTSLIEEMISLYGVLTKFLVTEKINMDDVVFGDYSHVKTNNEDIYEMYMLPENSESWDNDGYMFGEMDLINMDNVSLFVAKSSFDSIVEYKKIVGNLIIFPNNKIMEISNAEATVEGINNLFTYDNQKSVYKITCVPYHFKVINELNTEDISVDPDVPYETLDNYFSELTEITLEQDTEIEITPSVDTVSVDDNGDDIIVEKPIVDTDEDDVWGQLK